VIKNFIKKQLIIFLVLIFILGLVPVNFSEAISQNQINAEVQIICPFEYGGEWWQSSGSGTIIDSKGVILTNKHVVTDKSGGIIKTCVIGFVESINKEPNFGTEGNYNLAEVKYYTTADDMDAAILYLQNPTNKNYPYINIWNSNSDSLQFGEKLEVIGFPGVGGSTITYTSGNFSGYGSASIGLQNYLKTTAWIGHGNSGGAAYNESSGSFVGIPTLSFAENGDTMNYLLSINSIKTWLSGVLGGAYQQEVVAHEPIIQSTNVDLRDDITPPWIDNGWFSKFFICNEGSSTCNSIGADLDFTGKSNKIFVETDSMTLGLMDGYSKTIGTLYNYSDNISNLSQNSEISYTLDYDYYFDTCPGKGDNTCYLYKTKPTAVTNWIEFPSYGTYYIAIRFFDINKNISDKIIVRYIYEGDNQINIKPNPNIDGNIPDIDLKLANRLRGKILLQVESHGEAWYINPKDSKRYYMANGNEAYRIMRYLGIGITNSNLNKIKTNKTFAKNNSGKIFLQVEARDEAYYIDFNGIAHYLKNGAAAYTIMRELGLGITNNDLNKIPEGSL